MRSSCFPCMHQGWGCQGMGVRHESIPYVWARRDLSPEEKKVSQSRGVFLLVRIMENQSWDVGRAWESSLACREGKLQNFSRTRTWEKSAMSTHSCPLTNCPRSPAARCGGRESCFYYGATASPLTPAACSTLSFAKMQLRLATAPSAQSCCECTTSASMRILDQQKWVTDSSCIQNKKSVNPTDEFEIINQDLTWTTARVMVKGVQMISIQSILRAREDKEMYDLPSVFS